MKFCPDELEMNHDIHFDWNSSMQDVCEHNLLCNPTVIGRLNLHVGLYDTYFTSTKYKRVSDYKINGHFEEYIVKKRDWLAGTLVPVINRNVVPGTTVCLTNGANTKI